MPLSSVAQEIEDTKRLIFGDPCYKQDFGALKKSCEELGSSLVDIVLAQAGFDESGYGGSCCPLDILGMDVFTCIKMSLLQDFVEGKGFREMYAGPNGKLRFPDVLNEESNSATLPRVQYCVPTVFTGDIVKEVIVRSADPPPTRRCGDTLDLIPGESERYEFKDVTGYAGGSDSCELGTFQQYASLVYPDYEVARVPGLGKGLEPFESVSHWFVESYYENKDNKVNIQFNRGIDVPVKLNFLRGDTPNGYEEDFGPECVTEAKVSPKTCEPNPFNPDTPEAELFNKLSALRDYWRVIDVQPSFRVYGSASGEIPASLYTMQGKYDQDCVSSITSRLYQTTSKIYVTGVPLGGFKVEDYHKEFLDFGREQSYGSTFDLPQGEVWRDVTKKMRSDPIINIAFRNQPPPSAVQSKWVMDLKKNSYYERDATAENKTGFYNPFEPHIFTIVSERFAVQSASVELRALKDETQEKYRQQALAVVDKAFENKMNDMCSLYSFGGTLWGWGGSLYLVDEDSLYAAVRVNLPGVSVRTETVDAGSYIDGIKLKATPVIMVDQPSAVGYAGEYGEGYLDLYTEAQTAATNYCQGNQVGTTEADKLIEACKGLVLDVTLPFLFPTITTTNESDTSSAAFKGNFTEISDQCQKLARRIYDYIDKSKSLGSQTYICGPPIDPVPKVGEYIDGRLINSVNIAYQDGSSFTTTIECGVFSFTAVTAGGLNITRHTTVQVQGKILSEAYGSLYLVNVPILGTISAYNMDKYPWEVGDLVQVTIYNYPGGI